MIEPMQYKAFVDTIARTFPRPGVGLDVDDLKQEGFLALLRAVRRWSADHPGEPMPAAYAATWVRRDITKLVRRNRRAGLAINRDVRPDTLIDDTGPEPDTAAIDPALDMLGEPDASIVIARHGLDGNRPRSLAETGRAVGLHRTRVLRRERAALARLRAAWAS